MSFERRDANFLNGWLVVGGRNLLSEKLVDQYVSNDVMMGVAVDALRLDSSSRVHLAPNEDVNGKQNNLTILTGMHGVVK